MGMISRSFSLSFLKRSAFGSGYCNKSCPKCIQRNKTLHHGFRSQLLSPMNKIILSMCYFILSFFVFMWVWSEIIKMKM